MYKQNLLDFRDKRRVKEKISPVYFLKLLKLVLFIVCMHHISRLSDMQNTSYMMSDSGGGDLKGTQHAPPTMTSSYFWFN